MQTLTHPSWTEAFIAVVAVQAIAAVFVVFAGQTEDWLRRWLPYVVSLAVGVLLGTALLHLLPESIHALGNRPALWTTLVLTFLALFAFERIFRAIAGVRTEPQPDLAGQECEEIHHHHAHGAARPSTLLLGAITHSLADGTSVAAAFAVDRRLGWITAIAVALHEVPHRVGDFALLLHMDVERRRALWLAVLAGMSSIFGWLLVVLLGVSAPGRVAWLLPVSAASFLYISLVDLLPELFHERKAKTVLLQVLALAFGVLLAIGLTRLPDA